MARVYQRPGKDRRDEGPDVAVGKGLGFVAEKAYAHQRDTIGNTYRTTQLLTTWQAIAAAIDFVR